MRNNSKALRTPIKKHGITELWEEKLTSESLDDMKRVLKDPLWVGRVTVHSAVVELSFRDRVKYREVSARSPAQALHLHALHVPHSKL
jgi:hypothetical protein